MSHQPSNVSCALGYRSVTDPVLVAVEES